MQGQPYNQTVRVKIWQSPVSAVDTTRLYLNCGHYLNRANDIVGLWGQSEIGTIQVCTVCMPGSLQIGGLCVFGSSQI